MVRPLIIFFLLVLSSAAAQAQAPAQGQWSLSDGSIRLMDCPLSFEEGGRVRLPKGCMSFDAGVLLSRAAFVKGEGDIAVLLKKEDKAAQREKMLIDRIAQLESRVQELLIKEVLVEDDYSWALLPGGMILGALLVLVMEDL